MIRRVDVQNFMSLRDTSVELAPFTVFIGSNASGKSACFKALVTLSKLLSVSPVRGNRGVFTLDDGVTLDDLVWSGNSGLPISFRVWINDNETEEPDYILELSKRAAGWGVAYERYRAGDGWIEHNEAMPFEFPTEYRGTVRAHAAATLMYQVQRHRNDEVANATIAPILSLADAIGSTWRYRPSANDIARFVSPPTDGRNMNVADNGWGLAYVLQKLQGEDRTTFTKIENGLSALFPHITAVGFKSDFPGVRLTYMTDRSEDPLPAPQEADGVLLSTFLLWRLHTAGPNLRVCLEEPENGIHRSLLRERMKLLRGFAHPKDNSRHGLQILVATHSLDIDMFGPEAEHDRALAVEFNKQNGTSVKGRYGFEIDAARDRL